MEYISAKEYHIWFESLEEMKAELPAMTERANPDRWLSYCASHTYLAEKWFGVANAERAMELIDLGWPELSERLTQYTSQLKQTVDLASAEAVTIEVRRRKRHRMDYGDSLDMHRVWGGELDRAWERPVRTPRQTATQRYATVYVDLAMAGMYRFNTSTWRAAAALCMVEMLTAMGVNVEVWVGDSGRHSYADYDAPLYFWSGVRIKEYMQPLNDDRLATMCSAAMLRTWGFRMIMGGPWRTDYAYGYPLQTGIVKPLRDRQEAGERVFRIGNCLSLEEASRDVKGAIAALKKPTDDQQRREVI